MTREEIVEDLAESIYQYSNCIEEIEDNTDFLLAKVCEEVRELVTEKVKSRAVQGFPVGNEAEFGTSME